MRLCREPVVTETAIEAAQAAGFEQFRMSCDFGDVGAASTTGLSGANKFVTE